MQFIRDIWYVAAWAHELDHPIGRVVINDPIVLWRRPDGSVVAMEDRCPHRHAPLSLGRLEGDSIRCMYHGLRYSAAGACIEVPGSDRSPANSDVRVYPAIERDSWVWVWMGDPARADPGSIPAAYGLDNPQWAMRHGVLDYEADYRLINDNLTDLSHLDFVHETTLGAATGDRLSSLRENAEVVIGNRRLASRAGIGIPSLLRRHFPQASTPFLLANQMGKALTC